MDKDGWQSMDSAPPNGERFAVLNHDGEIWVCRYTKDGRLAWRSNKLHQPRSFEYVDVDGERLLREDKKFAADNEKWSSDWTLWARLYEFKPVGWFPLPHQAPAHER